MEEDDNEQHTSIRGRLLMLVNKIKGQAHKAEESTEKEQAAPCEQTPASIRKSNDALTGCALAVAQR